MDDMNMPSLTGAVKVAEASSSRPKAFAWTTLTIYFAEGAGPASFIAEVVGETSREGEVRRMKRKAFPTLARALNWSGFDPKSKLFHELRDKAVAWIEERARKAAGRIDFPAMLSADETASVQGFEPARTYAAGEMLRHGDETLECVAPRDFKGLGHAISWLYEGCLEEPALLGDIISLFVRDFPSIPRCTVEFFIERERGMLKEHVEPNAMTEGLVQGLVKAIRFIDREAFHASR